MGSSGSRRVAVFLVLCLCASALSGSGRIASADDDDEVFRTFHRGRGKTPRFELAREGVLFTAVGIGKTGDGRAVAQQFLERQGKRYGMVDAAKEVRHERVIANPGWTAHCYTQYVHGIPVEGGDVIVGVDVEQGAVAFVFNGFHAGIEPDGGEDPWSDRITRIEAIERAWRHLRVDGGFVIEPSATLALEVTTDSLTPVWSVALHVTSPYGSFITRVAAMGGEILSVRPEEGDEAVTIDAQREVRPFDEAQMELERREILPPATEFADAKARVFDPDPRTALRSDQVHDYSAPSVFGPAYVDVVLRDLERRGGRLHLRGPRVVLEDFDYPKAPPATTATGYFGAPRGTLAFTDAMTYFHIDESQRYLAKLDAAFAGKHGVFDKPLEVDPAAYSGLDFSSYSRSAQTLKFGHGCVDDNEDADVIVHEFGHALLESRNAWNRHRALKAHMPAIHEGFADYWAASYSLRRKHGDAFHPARLFDWNFDDDGTYCGHKCRRLDRMNARYNPWREYYGAHTQFRGFTSSELWGTPMFLALLEVRRQADAHGMSVDDAHDQMDRIIVSGHTGIARDSTMRDVAHKIIKTAKRLSAAGSVFASALRTEFKRVRIIR